MTPTPPPPTGYALEPPLQQFLAQCHREIAANRSGKVADYIPELSKANAEHFGISIATIDGHLYETGDSLVPFTIQSISKPFVFALALELLGTEAVEKSIGVEPSGEAFNSIRLTADNRPFNPMVNAGAIACSGLIYGHRQADAFDTIRTMLGRFAGRDLAVDEAVFASEQRTGDRNRAIGWLLRNYAVITDNVDETLDVYFRQCAILVTARDLAIMAATLANRGVNPVTGEQVLRPGTVAQTLSVMTSSGMYDYAGEWIFRVGIPAKSGVGGGIAAAIPSQIGIGTYAPRLDPHGNSVRGLKVCETLSSEFDMHTLNRSADVRSCIIADYDLSKTSSRRNRRASEQEILDRFPVDVRILEFVGALSFAHMDYVARHLTSLGAPAPLLILDFRRVSNITAAGARVLGEHLAALAQSGVAPVLAGFDRKPVLWKALEFWAGRIPEMQKFDVLDEAIEWAEDQVIARHGGAARMADAAAFGEHALLQGMSDTELADLRALASPRTFQPGERILKAGDAAESIYFLLTGRVTVRMPSGVRLASLSAGMEVGEQAMLGHPRIADVFADGDVSCIELTLENFAAFRKRYPEQAHRIMTNLAELLSKRLKLANAKIDALGA